ncbi:MAG TPA: GNAT family N-acetyltransferase [Jatrophihabitans sp.]|nr:GNAT family N-acetyltransferase [Jatrophihabitans sp.]
MAWSLTGDPEEFAAAALPMLLGEPVTYTVALTVLDSVRAGHRYSDQPMTFGWYAERGEVTGAVLQTPPWGLLVIALPAGSEAALAEQLRQRGNSIPEANGAEDAVRRFGAAWVAGTGLGTDVSVRQRLFRLDRLVPPDPAPAGSARLAAPADLDLLMDWMRAFRDEAEPRAGEPVRSMYQDRTERKLTWFWLDPQGEPVATAGRNVTVAGVSRVGPVYTPPEHRRHGYAAGVTAACTQHALDTDADQVILFTDVSNPTSNGVYQRLGYRPVAEGRLILRFG